MWQNLALTWAIFLTMAVVVLGGVVREHSQMLAKLHPAKMVNRLAVEEP